MEVCVQWYNYHGVHADMTRSYTRDGECVFLCYRAALQYQANLFLR